MLKPNISIVTICYNAENDIEKTMRSVLGQLYNDMEYIIVDGMSEDKTMQIVNNVIKDYPQKKINIISEPDKGIYDAMNKGINLASGKWLNFMNAGDIFADAYVLQKIFSNKIPIEKTFVYSDIYQTAYNGQHFLRKSNFSTKELKIIHQGVIYLKSLHKEHGLYAVTNKLIVSDYLFFLRIPVEQTFKVDTVIAIYAAHGISDSGNWCSRQMHCADVVFRRRSLCAMLFHYCAYNIKRILFPRHLVEWVKMHKTFKFST